MSDDNCAKSQPSTCASSVILPIAGRIVAAGYDDAVIELEGGDFAIGETVMVYGPLNATSRNGSGGNVTSGICIGSRRVQLDHYYGRVGKRVWARRPSPP